MSVQGFQDLVLWQKAVDLTVEIYALTKEFPPEERYGITQQVRRASVSVSSNIAEGSGRATTRDLLNFLAYSRGSVKETESLLIVSQRLDFLAPEQAERAMRLTDEVSRMITALRRLKAR